VPIVLPSSESRDGKFSAASLDGNWPPGITVTVVTVLIHGACSVSHA